MFLLGVLQVSNLKLSVILQIFLFHLKLQFCGVQLEIYLCHKVASNAMQA